MQELNSPFYATEPHPLKVGLVYFSATGTTHRLVHEAAAHLQDASVEVVLLRITAADMREGRYVNSDALASLKFCRGIIFASPTYMGGVAAQFKAFADATSELWGDQCWAGKLAAGITCGGGLNGDQTSTLQYLVTLAAQHGMLWLGLDVPGAQANGINRLACQLGVVAQSSDGCVEQGDLETVAALARRMAQFAHRLTSATCGEELDTER